MPVKYRSDILLWFSVAVALLLVFVLRHVLMVIYASVLFAVVLTPVVERLQRFRIAKWHLGRGAAIMLIIALGVAIVALFVAFAFPPIVRDIQQLAKDLPDKISALMQRMHNVPVLDAIGKDTMQRHGGQVAESAVKAVPGVAGLFVGFVSFLILTAYFILDGRRAWHWTVSLFPPESGPRLEATMQRARDRLRRWLTGQLLLMFILGFLSVVVYGLLGIRYFTVLGVFTGLANIVPIIGPIISIIIAVTIAAFDDWTKVLGVVIFYAVYQQIENAFLTPRIMKATVGLPSLAIVLALAIGGELAGVLGALVAVPSAAVISELVQEYLIKPHTARRPERALDTASTG
jgi:predicted PurR-regulated permease PerM